MFLCSTARKFEYFKFTFVVSIIVSMCKIWIVYHGLVLLCLSWYMTIILTLVTWGGGQNFLRLLQSPLDHHHRHANTQVPDRRINAIVWLSLSVLSITQPTPDSCLPLTKLPRLYSTVQCSTQYTGKGGQEAACGCCKTFTGNVNMQYVNT